MEGLYPGPSCSRALHTQVLKWPTPENGTGALLQSHTHTYKIWNIKKCIDQFIFIRSVQLLSHVWILTPWSKCDPMDCSTPGFPVHHQLLELAQTHVHRVGDAIQPSHPLSSPSPTFNLSQHQGLFQGVSSSHQVAKVLELQLQHQSFQWRMRWEIVQED